MIITVYTSEYSDLTIVSLDEVDFAREDLFGEKACSLSRLISRNYNVPQGIVISTKVFKRLMNIMPGTRRINQLIQELRDEILIKKTVDDPAEIRKMLTNYSTEIREIITTSPIPLPITNEIAGKIYELKKNVEPNKLILRLSANVEESTRFSYSSKGAVFNLESVDEIISLIKMSWASAFSTDVIQDLISNGLSPDNVKIAILIQELLKTRVSGLMRTNNFGSEEEEEPLQIRTTYGCWHPHNNLFDSVIVKSIGNDVEVETYITYKDSIMKIPKKGNPITVENHPKRRTKLPLNQQHIQLLIELARRFTKDFNTSYDVEFIIDSKNELCIIDAFPSKKLALRRIIGKSFWY